MKTNEMLTGLPGEALIREGLADFQVGRKTIAAFLIAIARTKFRRASLVENESVSDAAWEEAELQLYAMLRREGGNAYSRYNALLRELISFESAYEHRMAKQAAEKANRK